MKDLAIARLMATRCCCPLTTGVGTYLAGLEFALILAISMARSRAQLLGIFHFERASGIGLVYRGHRIGRLLTRRLTGPI